jgi:hypothetical protein
MRVHSSSSGVQLVAGLAWDISLTGALKPSQLVAKGKKFKANAYARFQGQAASRDALYGFGQVSKKVLARTKSKKKPESLISFACFSASLRPAGENFAVVVPFGDKSYAVAGILGGRPVLDLEGSLEEVSTGLAEFLEANQTSALYYLESLGKPPIEVEGLSLLALDDRAPSQDLLKLSSVQELPKEALGVVGLVVVLVALGLSIVGFLVWKHNEQQKQLALQAQQQLSPQQIYTNSRDAALATMTQLSAVDAGGWASSAFLALPTESGGWRLAGGECKLENSGFSCEAYWAPSKKGVTYREFASVWKGPSYFMRDLIRVVTPLPSAEKPTFEKISDSNLPSMQEFLRADGSFLQAITPLKFKAVIGEASLVGGPPQPKMPNMIFKADWALEGKVSLMRKLFEALPPNMALSSLEFQLPKDSKQPITFKATGVLYVKSI